MKGAMNDVGRGGDRGTRRGLQWLLLTVDPVTERRGGEKGGAREAKKQNKTSEEARACGRRPPAMRGG